MSLTVETCLLGLLPRPKKEKALPGLTNLALILAKRLLTKRWKATAPPRVSQWCAEMLDWGKAKEQLLKEKKVEE
ncbi:hypothetical protein NDU88_003550 [Pleurodeles waltl]|uniref:Uncharacterized protein n=1 Tax=Pleurodeles waltl TaxID=8319 RepID=A0AAV7NR62_PLEWA|nr:hypothetical protein NDU88_003550 [Pleurodeles waltl]